MGLDIVELVMTVEKEFGIDIPNVASEIVRVGDLHACVVQILRQHPDKEIETVDVWKRLKDILVKEFGIPVAQIVPEARLVDDLGLD
jgi:acyl carrier protein